MLKIAKITLLCLFIFSFSGSKKRFPTPSEKAIKEADKTVEQLAKEEIFKLQPSELAVFIWDIFKRGRSEDFSYYNANPKTLTEEQAKMPATILLQGYGSNQGEWLPLLKNVSEASENLVGPIFTLPYPLSSSKENLIKRIEEIKELYAKSGVNEVKIYLVGHSLGGITAADYTFNNDWVKGTVVEKVVSVASRLKNIEPPAKTPYYAYCYQLLPFIDEIWHSIEKNRGIAKLYAIAAEEDWLLPIESVLVGDEPSENVTVPDAGHALIARKKETAEKVISWLYPIRTK